MHPGADPVIILMNQCPLGKHILRRSVSSVAEKKAPAKKAAGTAAKKAAEAKKEVKAAEAKAEKTVKAAAAKAKAAVKKADKAVKAAPAKAKPAAVKAAKAPARKAKAAKLEIFIQSPMGGNITPEEIAAKLPEGAESVFVRVDQNKLWWIRGDESGSVAFG